MFFSKVMRFELGIKMLGGMELIGKMCGVGPMLILMG